MTDPIADLLTRLRNAQRVKHESVKIPFSRLKLEILKLLQREGFIGGYQTVSEEKGGKVIQVTLRYIGRQGMPVIQEIRRWSRPGRRFYVGSEEIPPIRSGLGIAILSTSKGVMTDREARASKVGGEVLCSVY